MTAHAAVWRDARINAACGNFFQGTWRTLEPSWLRPRHAGFLDFTDTAGALMSDFLHGGTGAKATLDSLDAHYARNLRNSVDERLATGRPHE